MKRVELPAGMNPREPALGALVGVAGAALLSASAGSSRWVARGFRE
jgi:hypothetical protein